MKRLIAALIGSLVLSLPSLSAAPAASDYNDALSLYKQKNYRAAAAKFEAAMRTNPRDPNIVYYCALSHQLSNERARARQLYEYVTTNFPTSSVCGMARAGLAQLGDTPGAAGIGSSSGASSSTYSSSSGAKRDPAYLAGLPDEIRVPLVRKAQNPTAAFLEANINGQPVLFHLDSGAFATVIGANQLEALGLGRPAGSKFEVNGVGDRDKVEAWQHRYDLKVGMIYRRDFPLVVQDNMQGEPLLGQNFLQDFNTTVDDAAGQIVFRKKSAGMSASRRGTKDIPFKVEGAHLVVEAQLNGKKIPMYFDTGASSVVFGFEDWKKLGFPFPDVPATGQSQGIAGSTNTWIMQVDTFKVGPITRDNFQVSLIESQKMGRPLLGQSFFSNYKYTIDRNANVIHLSEE